MLETGLRMPRALFALATAALLSSAAGCQLVSGLGGLETDASGGAGSTGKSSTTGVTASTSGETTSSASSSATSTSTDASSSTGTGSPLLMPCEGVIDTFDAGFDSTVWTTNNNPKFVNMSVSMSNAATVTVFTKTKTIPSECYASIRIVATTGGSINDLLGFTSGFPGLFLMNYLPSNHSLTTSGNELAPKVIGAKPDAIAIAVHGPSLYLLYAMTPGAPWQLYGTVPRPAWMDANPSEVVFGVISGGNGQSAIYDDFNVVPVALSDVP